ncbi:MAG: hypothetical protein ABMA02_12195 [Saprospiraceae bacterium]
MTDERKQGMEATRRKLETELENLLQCLALGTSLEVCVFALSRKKFSNISIRGFFVYALYEYIREQARLEGHKLQLTRRKRLFDTQLPLVFELIISAQYLVNQILDGKGGVLKNQTYDMAKVKENTLAASYLKDVLYEYVETTIFPNETRKAQTVQRYIRQAFQIVDEGQLLEQRYSSFVNFQNGFAIPPPFSAFASRLLNQELEDELWNTFQNAGLSNAHESFTRFYLQRVFCTNAAPFALMTDLVLDLTGYDGPQRENIRRFGRSFGMLAQLVNDLTDLLPMRFEQDTIAKIPEDAYSDLRNDNITLPLIFFLDQNPDYPYPSLRHDLHTSEKQDAVFELLKPLCRTTLIPMLREWAGQTKRTWLSRGNPNYAFFGDVISIARNGRYFNHFGKIEKKQPPDSLKPDSALNQSGP